MFARIMENLVSFRRVPVKIVIITALASYVLQLGAILLGYPLYVIAIFTLLPWIPVVFIEGIWKIEHYSWIAVFGIIVILQIGHLGEHVTQVSQLAFFNGTLACPPPVDNDLLASRAVEAGLRDPDVPASGFSSANVIKPDPATGLPAVDSDGNVTKGPASCGVLGQLDLEIVHLVWEIMGWIATGWLIVKFPSNKWLWVALIAVSIHGIEHLFISYLFFIDVEPVFTGVKQIWATTIQGNIVTANPVGLEPAVVNFYSAGGKNGIVGAGGMLEVLLNIPKGVMPTRPFLHFWYNTVVFVPTMIAFIQEVRRMYDEYLAAALPNLSEEQLIQTTPHLDTRRFKAGDVILRQGDPAVQFYILTKGECEVVREQNGEMVQIATLRQGQYFGEVGLLHGGKRMATITALTDVEVLGLNREIFRELMEESELSKTEVEQIIRQRVDQTKALAQPNIEGDDMSITATLKKLDISKEKESRAEGEKRDSE